MRSDSNGGKKLVKIHRWNILRSKIRHRGGLIAYLRYRWFWR